MQDLDLLFLRSKCVNRYLKNRRQFSEWTSIGYLLSRGGGNVVEVYLEKIKHLIRQRGWRIQRSRFMMQLIMLCVCCGTTKWFFFAFPGGFGTLLRHIRLPEHRFQRHPCLLA